jgi:hypothetical protein
MFVILYFGTRQVRLNVGTPNWIFAGVGVHRLTLPLIYDTRSTMRHGVLLRIYGQAWLGGFGGDWLGRWETDEPTITYEGENNAQIVLTLSDDQFAIIEQRRASADLQIALDVCVEIGFDPDVVDREPEDRWPAKTGQEIIYVTAESWRRMLDQAGKGMSLAVVLPMPVTGELGEHLRLAIQKINKGEYADAVGEARKCFDVMEAQGITPENLKTIADETRDKRSLSQRFSLLSHGLHAVSGPATHADPNAKTMVWNRETAMAVVAGITALVACRDLMRAPQPR